MKVIVFKIKPKAYFIVTNFRGFKVERLDKINGILQTVYKVEIPDKRVRYMRSYKLVRIDDKTVTLLKIKLNCDCTLYLNENETLHAELCREHYKRYKQSAKLSTDDLERLP